MVARADLEYSVAHAEDGIPGIDLTSRTLGVLKLDAQCHGFFGVGVKKCHGYHPWHFFVQRQLALLGMAESPMARSLPGGPIWWVPVDLTLPHDVMSIPKAATPRVADVIARYLFIFNGVGVVPSIRFPNGRQNQPLRIF